MSFIMWAGLRQIEALRESVAENLRYGAVPRLLCTHDKPDLTEEMLTSWLAQNGLDETNSRIAPGFVYINQAMDEYYHSQVKDRFRVMKAAQRTAHSGIEDFGVERSGAGWEKLGDFIITSAFVRLLGAWEQFELDVLKALFHYRPSGEILGPPDESELIEVEAEIVTEQPNIKDKKEYFSKPVLWTWIKDPAKNKEERRKIFKNVFKIEQVNGGRKEKQKQNRQRDEWYEKRNAIAHGRKEIMMTLREYGDVEVFVTNSMLYMAEQCKTKLKIEV